MQKKILIAIILNVVVVSVTLSIVSYVTIHQSIDRSLQNRLALARSIANSVESVISRNLARLHDGVRSEGINLDDADWVPEQRMLETVYRYSLFGEGVFLLDRRGTILLTYPHHVKSRLNLSFIPYVSQVFDEGRPVISNVYTIEPMKRRVIFMLTPVTNDRGDLVGIAGGMLSPTDDFLPKMLQSVNTEPNTYLEIIDANEVVIASDNPARLLAHHDHDSIMGRMIRDGRSEIVECKHGYSHPGDPEKAKDLLAFVPFRTAPWGIIIGQSEKDIFAPTIALQREFLLFVLVFAGTSAILAFVMSKGIVKPLRSLSSAVDRIASGDLATPVGKVGTDEILSLSNSFDDMRSKLADSLEHIRMHNLELENRVAARTREIRDSRRQVRHLLKKVISSQEEERRRIARDLHDTIVQDVSAFLIQLDICKLQPDLIRVEKIDEMRRIATKIIDDMHAVMKDLRPSVLDDLGLADAFVWLMNQHLKAKGINWYLDIGRPLERRLPPEVEITLFRIFQEAIINIARHAGAENVFVTVDVGESHLEITIEDDGQGFDIHELAALRGGNGRGLGITGMKERAVLVGGKMQVHTLPGEGTRVCIQVPMEAQGEHV